MASSCRSFIGKLSLSAIKSAIRSNATKSTNTRSATSAPFSLPTRSSPSPGRRFSLSRIGMRAVAAATAQRGGCGEDDVMPQHNIEELQSRYTLPHLSRTLVIAFALFLSSLVRRSEGDLSAEINFARGYLRLIGEATSI